jgi:uncharacterized protein YcbK (DUF882 family)
MSLFDIFNIKKIKELLKTLKELKRQQDNLRRKNEEKHMQIPNCGHSNMPVDPELQKAADALDSAFKAKFGRNLTANSGVRCPACNNKAGGAAASAHLLGKAVDVAFNDNRERYFIKKWLYGQSIGRIGHGKTFVHFDTATTKDGYSIAVEWDY